MVPNSILKKIGKNKRTLDFPRARTCGIKSGHSTRLQTRNTCCHTHARVKRCQGAPLPVGRALDRRICPRPRTFSNSLFKTFFFLMQYMMMTSLNLGVMSYQVESIITRPGHNSRKMEGETRFIEQCRACVTKFVSIGSIHFEPIGLPQSARSTIQLGRVIVIH